MRFVPPAFLIGAFFVAMWIWRISPQLAIRRKVGGGRWEEVQQQSVAPKKSPQSPPHGGWVGRWGHQWTLHRCCLIEGAGRRRRGASGGRRPVCGHRPRRPRGYKCGEMSVDSGVWNTFFGVDSVSPHFYLIEMKSKWYVETPWKTSGKYFHPSQIPY